MSSIFGLIFFIIWIATIVDIVNATHIETLGKTVWVLVALFFPLVGTIAWFIFGRE